MNPHPTRRVALFTLLLTLALTGALMAQELKIGQAAPTDPTAPGPAHKRLEALAGRWIAEAQLTPEHGEEPVQFRGGAMSEMILGGRFLKTEYKGEMMGEAMLGFGLDGYDNVTGKHQGVWVDTAGTAMFKYEGTWNEDGTVLTTYGEYVHPESGETVKARNTTTIKTTSTYTFESAMANDKGEYVLNSCSPSDSKLRFAWF